MGPLYSSLCTRFSWPLDDALAGRLKKQNEEDLAKLDLRITEGKEKFGDVEVFERQRDRADYFVRIGDKAAAQSAYASIADTKLSTGQKIDIATAQARLAIAYADWPVAKERLALAKELNDKGGDWDRRNRLKVYEATYAMVQRDFKLATDLLLDSIATFTASEMYAYPSFTFYVVLMSLKCLDRAVLKKQVIDSPDILTVIDGIPHLSALLNSFYDGRYSDFMQALVDIYPSIAQDTFLHTHVAYYVREMRVAAYVQFLGSYKSVTMEGMARSFGVSQLFLDRELSRFISSGRLNARIDAVAGVVETTRPDSKNAQYIAVIKMGDALLNRVQKLSRVVSL